MSPELRPILQERTEYKPGHPVEEYIVPLLKLHIDILLAAHAKPLGSGCKALDVGCGSQPFRRILEGYGLTYFGLDTQPASDGSVAFVAAIDSPLPPEVQRAGPFDFVLCTEVLEHVANWPMAFDNLAQMTIQGGMVLVTCPHYYILHEEPYDFWRPTLHAIRYHSIRAGFKVVSAEAAGTPWDVFGTWLGAVAPMATNRTITNRAMARLFHFGRQSILFFLRKGWIQRRIALRGKTYLSNIVVLERQ